MRVYRKGPGPRGGNLRHPRRGALAHRGAGLGKNLSASDVVVPVALGSHLLSIPLGAGVTLADRFAAAMATVLLLQEATRLLVKRSPKADKIVKERPHLSQRRAWDILAP